MRRWLPRLMLVATILSSGSALQAAPFTYANLVVLQVGDGNPITNNDQPQPVVLKEFTVVPGSGPVQSIAMPTTLNLPNHRLTIPRSAFRAGALTRTTDGKQLLLTGYDADPGVDPVAGVPSPYASAASLVNRVVGRVDVFGNIDTTTALTDAYNGGEGIEGAASEDGTNLYIAGRSAISGAADTATGAVRYATLGATTSVRLGPTGNFSQAEFYRPRVVNIFTVGGVRSLYATFNYSGNRGVHSFANNGDGTLQTAAGGASPTRVREITINQNQNSIYDFWFMDDTTAYMCVDDPIPAGAGNNPGGVNKYKYEQDPTTLLFAWKFKYTLNAGLPTQTCLNPVGTTVYSQTVRGLTGHINANGQAELFVITAEYDACQIQNQLMKVTDTGCPKNTTVGCSAADTFVNLQTAPINTTFRGVDWVPRSCDSGQCPGACCHAGFSCSDTLQQDCAAPNKWLGLDTACETSTCPLVCHDPFADADGDRDVDMEDFSLFQKCYTGAFPSSSLPESCRCFDRDANGLIDDVDYGDPLNPVLNTFLRCVSRAGVPADVHCDDQ